MTSDPSAQLPIVSTDDDFAAMQQNAVEAPFPIVGIAASAGGLEAFTQLLTHLPTDTGMAIVLIQHLSPEHKSLLSEILSRVTTLPVREVRNGMVVEPNQVYVIPPNTKMILFEGTLQLSPREKVFGKYMPGDAFFTSLALDRGHKAIAVVLSGGDGDGSLGLKAIKAAGGVTFAQCEDTAQFDSMPNTAVATGNVDFVLPPARIAEELATLSRNPMLLCPRLPIVAEALPTAEDALATILGLLRSTTGVDFSSYKPNTIDRRIQRRMLLYKLEQLEDYAAYLQAHPAEIKALYEEILIHVTSFFRDPDAFEGLKERVFPLITQKKSADVPIRIWVAGCSTGEEVYSIAICLVEFLDAQSASRPIQIFATDISEQAIDHARAGIYTENQMVDVSIERRRRFFYALEGDRYQINKGVRELCVFARQNLGSDPPFSNLDLISCRNVLIYLGDALQKRIMPIFHYSLKPSGFLLLGTAESTGQAADLFTLVEPKYRLYAKQMAATRRTFSFTPSNYPILQGRGDANARVSDRPSLQAPSEEFDLQKKVDQLIASQYAPTGVVIDDKMQVLQLRGDIDRYLRLVSGVANLNLFNLVRDGLLVELRAAIYQAQRQDVPIIKHDLQLEEGDSRSETLREPVRGIKLQVIPFNVPTTEDRRYLILFEDEPPISSPVPLDPEHSQGELEQELTRLRQALAAANEERTATQEYLQAVIQEQEHSNQDLKVANEEILSSNEELQSTNEELETAKEEIQATNEELNTTNEELRSRNAELHQVNNDLTNLLASINVPILMLTNDLRIRRFTPMAQRLFNFIPTDAGRPLSDIRANLNVPDLELLLLDVLETLSVKEMEVQTQGGHWYMLRIRPYRTIENQIDGVVLVLLDIDALKRSTTTLEEARNYAEAIVETVQVPLLVLESDLRVNTANQAFYDTFQVAPLETAQTLIFELGNGQWSIPGLRSRLEAILANDGTVQNFEVTHEFERIGQKTVLLNGCKIRQDGDAQRILLSIEDITERRQFETERSQLLNQEQSVRQEAEAANRAKDEFLSNLSHELRNPLNTMLGWAQVLRQRQFDDAMVNRALDVMERSARAQSQLVEDMLDISRITSGKMHLDTRLLDLGTVITAAIEAVQLAADAKAIEVRSEMGGESGRVGEWESGRVDVDGTPSSLIPHPSPFIVLGDSDRLLQVLWNLLFNAIKFTPKGGRVAVRLEQVEGGRVDEWKGGRVDETLPIDPSTHSPIHPSTHPPIHTYAQITVTDTGQGIRADVLPYVFDRFRQGDSSISKSSQGLGLGLSIVRHIVELHGGTVQAASPGEGQGTTMTVRLPLRSVPVDVAAPIELEPTTAEPLDRQALPSLAGLHILAVDDEADSLDLNRWTLEDAGATVVAVTSAREAIAALTESPDQYDVLLADIGMPDEDGLALIRRVRSLEAATGGQIPAAAITAYVTERERQKAIEAGFQRHIAKPIDLAQLIWTVALLVGRANEK